jgi:hypothetical protein
VTAWIHSQRGLRLADRLLSSAAASSCRRRLPRHAMQGQTSRFFTSSAWSSM